jgi:hypothetical protein
MQRGERFAAQYLRSAPILHRLIFDALNPATSKCVRTPALAAYYLMCLIPLCGRVRAKADLAPVEQKGHWARSDAGWLAATPSLFVAADGAGVDNSCKLCEHPNLLSATRAFLPAPAALCLARERSWVQTRSAARTQTM